MTLLLSRHNILCVAIYGGGDIFRNDDEMINYLSIIQPGLLETERLGRDGELTGERRDEWMCVVSGAC